MRDRIAKALSRLLFFLSFFFLPLLPLPETALGADDTSNQPVRPARRGGTPGAPAAPHPRRAGPGPHSHLGQRRPRPRLRYKSGRRSTRHRRAAVPRSGASAGSGSRSLAGPPRMGAAPGMPFSPPAAPLGFALLLLAAAGRSLPVRRVSAAAVPAPFAPLARPRWAAVAARAPGPAGRPAVPRPGVPRLFCAVSAGQAAAGTTLRRGFPRRGAGRGRGGAAEGLEPPRKGWGRGPGCASSTIEKLNPLLFGCSRQRLQQHERPPGRGGRCAETFRAWDPV